MTRVAITRTGAVDCRAELTLALSALSAWGQLRDFPRYARQDHFHQEIHIEGGIPRTGAALRLAHAYVGMRTERVGRILWWREGIGYSYSDLSIRGPRHGFPHIFSYRLRPLGAASCALEIRVRGRWTLRRIPHWITRLWLRWIFGHLVVRVRNQLMIYQIARRRTAR